MFGVTIWSTCDQAGIFFRYSHPSHDGNPDNYMRWMDWYGIYSQIPSLELQDQELIGKQTKCWPGHIRHICIHLAHHEVNPCESNRKLSITMGFMALGIPLATKEWRTSRHITTTSHGLTGRFHSWFTTWLDYYRSCSLWFSFLFLDVPSIDSGCKLHSCCMIIIF